MLLLCQPFNLGEKVLVLLNSLLHRFHARWSLFKLRGPAIGAHQGSTTPLVRVK